MAGGTGRPWCATGLLGNLYTQEMTTVVKDFTTAAKNHFGYDDLSDKKKLEFWEELAIVLDTLFVRTQTH